MFKATLSTSSLKWNNKHMEGSQNREKGASGNPKESLIEQALQDLTLSPSYGNQDPKASCQGRSGTRVQTFPEEPLSTSEPIGSKVCANQLNLEADSSLDLKVPIVEKIDKEVFQVILTPINKVKKSLPLQAMMVDDVASLSLTVRNVDATKEVSGSSLGGVAKSMESSAAPQVQERVLGTEDMEVVQIPSPVRAVKPVQEGLRVNKPSHLAAFMATIRGFIPGKFRPITKKWSPQKQIWKPKVWTRSNH